MLVLRVQAEFAAFRAFVAGSYRNSAPFITPTAAYGLLLNIAGIESRLDDGESLMTRTRDEGLPRAKIAVGMIIEPTVASLYQQLHNYPVTGKDKKAGLARSKGAKYNIQPVRRELLCGIDGYIALNHNAEFERHVRAGLDAGIATVGADGHPRYGVPFLGDNSHVIDKLTLADNDDRTAARWYCRLRSLPEGETPEVRPGICRMTTWIDRGDMSRTRSELFAPSEKSPAIPGAAWIDVGPPKSE